MAARCTNVPTALSQRLRKPAKRSPPVPPTSHGRPRLSAPVVLAQIALSQIGARFAMTHSEVQLKIVAENARSMLNSLAGVPETVSLREDFLKQRDMMIAAAAEAQYSAMVLGATGTWADASCMSTVACLSAAAVTVRAENADAASKHGSRTRISHRSLRAHCRSPKPIFKMTILVPATRGMGLRGQCRGPRRPVHLVSLLIWYPKLKEVMLRRSAAARLTDVRVQAPTAPARPPS